MGGRRLTCLKGASATSSLLVKGALATCSRFLAGAIGLLVKKAVSCASGLLAGGFPLASTSGDEECPVLVRP